ncbi:MAG: IclR family transcriptional regulator [Lacisediminihabitans sp.]
MPDERGRSMIARTAMVLRAFDQENDSLTISELSARTGLPIGTTHRIARDLVAERLLDREGSVYSIGTGLWEAGELAAVSLRFRETALPFLLALYEATGENVHLAILEGWEALYVARLVGPRSVPTISRMGGRLPLHTTGVGKALLAYQSEEFLTEFFARPLSTPTRYSLGTESAVRSELSEIRAAGFSRTRQEMTLGNAVLAVPIFVDDGVPFAAVSLVTHLARADERRNVPLLKAAATEMGAALRVSLAGGRRWPAPPQ